MTLITNNVLANTNRAIFCLPATIMQLTEQHIISDCNKSLMLSIRHNHDIEKTHYFIIYNILGDNIRNQCKIMKNCPLPL